MANGMVSTGFSKPYVAVYGNNGNTVTYTSGQVLARGVSVSLEVEKSSNNDFYADNQIAESAAGSFSGGTLTLTVDGLKKEARRLIYGLPDAGSDGFVSYGDSMSVPFVAVGYISRYMEDGVVKFIPQIVPKCKFNLPSFSHNTQESEISWHTEELVAVISRSDESGHAWFMNSDTTYSTEAAAEAALKTKLGIAG